MHKHIARKSLFFNDIEHYCDKCKHPMEFKRDKQYMIHGNKGLVVFVLVCSICFQEFRQQYPKPNNRYDPEFHHQMRKFVKGPNWNMKNET
jgi:hypothetical protein